ncbi:energy-coupling factor transporter transmembrane protein EcfT [uncultured Finegoldia sp.]|uniref:energy-coupling factor transporter transmembrane component T family protein n=1 Tax=uncultured Finegoldia sp. TaxID=328009 RepID=UPI00260F7591|nr:energy-coupling factor transporter transmembrane component T [uncultured Finegoldia sp.]
MISKIFPTTKLFIVIVASTISLVLPWKFAYLFVLPVCLILAALDNKFKPFAKKLSLVLIFVLSIMFLFQLFLDKSNEFVYLNLGFMRVTLNGILNALEQTKFILTLISLFLLFFETTDIEELMISLQQKKVSHVTSYVIMATMTMIPEMIKKSSKILKAQEARGIETKGSLKNRAKAFFPSLGPLIISSLSEIDEKTITLEARGFSSENKKTCLKEIKKTTADKIIFYVFIILVVLALVWRFK